MASNSWAVSEALQEINSQKASLEDALRQVALASESFESQANQAINDVQEAVARQISQLNHRQEQLLLQIEALRLTEGQQLQTREEQLKKAITILSSAMEKIKALPEGHVADVNQRGLQQGLAQLFDAVKEIIDSVDDLTQQDLQCQVDRSQLQEAITSFGQVDIAGPHEAEHEIPGTISPMKRSVNTILSSCSGVSAAPADTDDLQLWLTDAQMGATDDLLPIEAVLQGLQKQSERCDLVWLVDHPVQPEKSSLHYFSLALEDDSQHWLFTGETSDEETPAEKVIAGLQKIYMSDMSLWLKSSSKPGTSVGQEQSSPLASDLSHWRIKDDAPERPAETGSVADALQHALKQLDEEAGEWSRWIQSTSSENNSTESSPLIGDVNCWVVPTCMSDTYSPEEGSIAAAVSAAFKRQMKAGETGTAGAHCETSPHLQSNSPAEAVTAALQTQFGGPVMKWRSPLSEPVDNLVLSGDGTSMWLTEKSAVSTGQQAAEEVGSGLQEKFRLSDYSVWLANPGVFEGGGSSGSMDYWLAMSSEVQSGSNTGNSSDVIAAFQRLNTEESDYTMWLSPNSPIETPMAPAQLCDQDQWLFPYQDSPSVTGCSSVAMILGLDKLKKSSSHLHWLKKAGRMQKLLMSRQLSPLARKDAARLASEAMASALKRLDEESTDISQWLAIPTESGTDAVASSMEALQLEDDSTEDTSQWLLHGEQNHGNKEPLSFPNQHLESNDLSLWLYHAPGDTSAGPPASTLDEDVRFWLSTKPTDYPDGDFDLESNATSQEFEIIDHFSKSGHSSLDDNWLDQPEQ